MKKVRWSGYDKYLVLADSSQVLKGNYNGYLNFKDVIGVINTLITKRTNQYLYNGEVIQFSMKQGDIESIMNCWDEAEYHPRFDLIRYVSNKMNLKNI